MTALAAAATTPPLALFSWRRSGKKKQWFLAGCVAQMPDMQAWEVTDEGGRREGRSAEEIQSCRLSVGRGEIARGGWAGGGGGQMVGGGLAC